MKNMKIHIKKLIHLYLKNNISQKCYIVTFYIVNFILPIKMNSFLYKENNIQNDEVTKTIDRDTHR
ncbi:hypothetical protein Vspart_04519 [Vibrio spartinae]|uniref:Uncharacterized protein n=1 Tax=Vibrio spartinae TaxID=1918945 RepID=A0ABX6R6Z2_9VIBR|nr:hypothetical protein Vspart_04519 [Vibrio spartinae]